MTLLFAQIQDIYVEDICRQQYGATSLTWHSMLDVRVKGSDYIISSTLR